MSVLENKINNYLKKLEPLVEVKEINALTEELVASSVDAEFSSIWYFDQEKFVLRRERYDGSLRELVLNAKKGIIYKCFMEKTSKLYNYLASDKDYVASIDNPDNIKIKSKIMLPLMDGEKFVGIVTAYNSIKNSKKFVNNDVEVLKKLSQVIIKAIYKMQEPEHEKEVNISSVDKNEVVSKKTETNDETLTFVANFVHDIRTPANSLHGFLDLLESQIKDERLKSYITNAKESASFINELTTSVLNMVSTHQESSSSYVQEVDSIKFFSSLAKSFSSNMYAKKICFNIYIDPMIPKSIKIDTLKMKRVILNLIGNAYKFTPNHRSIEFSVRYVTKTNRIVMYVKDTGIGIPPEKQKTIFEAFKQAEDVTALNYGGTGLGLFISAKYVNELGGTLALISEVDKGSTFSFDIPADVTDSMPSYTPLDDNNKKIAIVMDNKNSYSANNIAKYMVRMGLKKDSITAYPSVKEAAKNAAYLIVFQNKMDIKEIQKVVKKGRKILIVEEEFLSLNHDEICLDCDVISKYGFVANKLYKFIKEQKQTKVLIVDDDSVSVLLISTILENEFCTTTIARDGKEALALFKEAHEKNEPFEVMYIDNNMPIMNGNEAMQKMREYEQVHAKQAIYAVSTSGDKYDLKEESEIFDLQLGKPFRKEQIREALQHK